MRVILLGKKSSSVEALGYLLEKGVTVTAIVAPPHEKDAHWEPKLTDAARDFGIPLLSEEELYAYIGNPKKPPRKKLKGCIDDIDVVFSFLFWNRIKKPVITLAKKGVINFHPAPLPDLRGVGGYNIALYEKMNSYGVSAHFIDEAIDTGDIIKVVRFPIDPNKETVDSLEQKSQKYLVEIFKGVVSELLGNKELPRLKQTGGKYFSKKDFEVLREISPQDSAETVERKIRAFWYPPYPGASITLSGTSYTVVNDSLLKGIGVKDFAGAKNPKGFVSEKGYAEAVGNLTLKYVDIVGVIASDKKQPERFVFGVRKENPGRGFVWPAGGRSKHLMPYKERARELVAEDYGIEPKTSKLFCIGTARLYWPNSRFNAQKGTLTTDGDITIFAAEFDTNAKLTTGSCFAKLCIMTEKEARRENTYLAYLIDCYRHYQKHKTPQPVEREFKF